MTINKCVNNTCVSPTKKIQMLLKRAIHNFGASSISANHPITRFYIYYLYKEDILFLYRTPYYTINNFLSFLTSSFSLIIKCIPFHLFSHTRLHVHTHARTGDKTKSYYQYNNCNIIST
jgi:hypothetical protein